MRLYPNEPRAPDTTQVVGANPADEGIAYLDVEPPRPRSADPVKAEPLPAVRLDAPIHLAGATLSEALALVLSGTDVSYMVAPGLPATSVAQVSGLRGSLENVLSVLSDAYGVYFTYSGGVLRAEPSRQYLIELPPIKELVASVEKVLTQRGATDVSVDSVSGHVSYRASYPVARALDTYLQSALNQPLLVLELNIIEVRLSSADQGGIQWNKLSFVRNAQDSLGLGTTSSVATAAGSLSVISSLGSRLSLDVLLKFLATQGTVKTVSQPRVQLLSGGSTELKIGDTVRYISKVGTAQVGNTGSAQTTTEVTDLDTGIKLSVGGRYWQDTVVANLELEMSELLGFDVTPLGNGQSLKLPRTTKRNLGSNTLRLRPGETGMLFGLITTRDTDTREGMTNAPLLALLSATNIASAKERSELVIVVRPRVLKFGKAPATGSQP